MIKGKKVSVLGGGLMYLLYSRRSGGRGRLSRTDRKRVGPGAPGEKAWESRGDWPRSGRSGSPFLLSTPVLSSALHSPTSLQHSGTKEHATGAKGPPELR